MGKPPITDPETIPAAVSIKTGKASRKPRLPENARLLLYRFVHQMTASAFDLTFETVMQADRGHARALRARQIAMYLMNTSLSMTFVEIADYFDRDRTTVSYACNVIEELRDNPAFDTRLNELEATVRTVLTLCNTQGEGDRHA